MRKSCLRSLITFLRDMEIERTSLLLLLLLSLRLLLPTCHDTLSCVLPPVSSDSRNDTRPRSRFSPMHRGLVINFFVLLYSRPFFIHTKRCPMRRSCCACFCVDTPCMLSFPFLYFFMGSLNDIGSPPPPPPPRPPTRGA